MVNNNFDLSELQEILLWQQLNKQLIELRAVEKSIKDDHHKFLQTFCLKNGLFSKITADSLIDEIPLSLITDFANTAFIHVNLPSWNKCITELMPQTYVLDIEDGQAGAFDMLSEYDRAYHLTEDENENDEDNEELFTFISEYTDLKESQDQVFSDILLTAYGFKSTAVQDILDRFDSSSFLTITESSVTLDFANSPDKSIIRDTYLSFFCEKVFSLEYFSAVQWTFDLNLHEKLTNKLKESEPNKSLTEYIEHEINLLQKESNLLKDFSRDLNSLQNALNLFEIKICDISPFSFLPNPLPRV